MVAEHTLWTCILNKLNGKFYHTDLIAQEKCKRGRKKTPNERTREKNETDICSWCHLKLINVHVTIVWHLLSMSIVLIPFILFCTIFSGAAGLWQAKLNKNWYNYELECKKKIKTIWNVYWVRRCSLKCTILIEKNTISR